VRVVPIGKLFEKKIRLAARLAAGKVAPPNVRYWVNSGRHLLNSSSSDFDTFQTFGLTNCCCANGHREPHFACRKFLL